MSKGCEVPALAGQLLTRQVAPEAAHCGSCAPEALVISAPLTAVLPSEPSAMRIVTLLKSAVGALVWPVEAYSLECQALRR